MDSIELIGDTLIIIGEILIAYMVISVHNKLRSEHRLDGEVFDEIYREQMIGIISILLLVVGFGFRVLGRYIL